MAVLRRLSNGSTEPIHTILSVEWPRGRLLRADVVAQSRRGRLPVSEHRTTTSEPGSFYVSARARVGHFLDSPTEFLAALWTIGVQRVRGTSVLAPWLDCDQRQLRSGIFHGTVHLDVERAFVASEIRNWTPDSALCSEWEQLAQRVAQCPFPEADDLSERLRAAVFFYARGRFAWMTGNDATAIQDGHRLLSLAMAAPVIGDIVLERRDVRRHPPLVPCVPWAALLELGGDLFVLSHGGEAAVTGCYLGASRLYFAAHELLAAGESRTTADDDEGPSGLHALGEQSLADSRWSPARRMHRYRAAMARLRWKLSSLPGGAELVGTVEELR